MGKADNIPKLVIVHPLVLLSVVDHYTRLRTTANQRVVGVLLGSVSRGTVDVTNSYAVPFEEDDRPGNNFFFLDQNFHENMWNMFKKVSARERVVGWYSTGPKIRTCDLQVNELFRKYTSNPVYVIVDAQLKEVEIPTKAYISVEEVLENGQTANRFQHIGSVIEALEAEEVGVEHLLRDVKDTNISGLATKINDNVSALKSLMLRIGDLNEYLEDVTIGKLPINHVIVNQIQQLFNLIPNLSQEHMIKAFNSQTNDKMMVIYLASLIRSIITLHNLINNKLEQKISEENLDNRKEKNCDSLNNNNNNNNNNNSSSRNGNKKDEKDQKNEINRFKK